ncbi:LPS-assembly lipoprotein [Bisgaardia hudsonensis]|uniref:LPS-assembly lipoprotein LptE n=1 Tax=Bisgaardia hudsonensis TaxID=109472 RepID=A0A4R2MV52_9PAST|nr:LPS assembly lipoprotein LptE [Bisgaardia hudsonensis]QLB13689.1 hypothetical protein A6A11_08730 [Bisgaardia hudsonensis]TCP12023.1 LPS-assembly lipoprotein [Bisgaardia hudsonensis]
MQKKIKVALATIGLFLTGCGFHFQTGELLPVSLKTLTLESNDQYSRMTMALRKQLLINNVRLVDSQKDIPVLRLNKTSISDEVASIFKQGKEAEKLLILDVEATVRLANSKSYPLTTRVTRTFFDNSRAALAKSAEKEVIWNDMREQAARQILSQMVALQNKIVEK